ncbi:hypothetical protein Emin_0850 [Elusimicrobium minutum Pei191]|uniref:Uncharacterized protein n=1 Tax=Elusimicrobium minutum (strain Pei191) TaxID=445932 RepID=B2KD09_ELUMP|nr:hypothetical protein Emin_0850 [Elusimicrobium minutum Pei191]
MLDDLLKKIESYFDKKSKEKKCCCQAKESKDR